MGAWLGTPGSRAGGQPPPHTPVITEDAALPRRRDTVPQVVQRDRRRRCCCCRHADLKCHLLQIHKQKYFPLLDQVDELVAEPETSIYLPP